MRRVSIIALFVASLAASSSDARAEPYYPWCARYGWSTICSYATFQQCQASVSGAGGYCTQNVMPPPVAERRVGAKRRHRH